MSTFDQHHTRLRDMQRLFRCDWPNGDVSFVLARDEEDAIAELDETGEAEKSMLTEVFFFQIHLELRRKQAARTSKDNREWGFALEGFGELTGEYMDLDAAVARRRTFESRRKRRGSPEESPRVEVATPNNPLRQLSDIEFRNAFDQFERGPDSLLGAMLDAARASRSGTIIRTSAVVLVLENGEERPIAAFSEYGDDEGRETAACCLRYCARLGALTGDERLERLLLETRLPDLTTTRAEDPVAADSGYAWLKLSREEDDVSLRQALETETNMWKKRVTDARKGPMALLVSVGMLTLSDGTMRSFCEVGELGDNDGRMAVADKIRTSRRVGLLREGESLSRHMLEIHLHPLQAVLKLDALRDARKN